MRLLASLNAFDNFLSAARADRERFFLIGVTISGPASPISAKVGFITSPPCARLAISKSSSAKVKATAPSIEALPAGVFNNAAAVAPPGGPPAAVAPAMNAARYKERNAL